MEKGSRKTVGIIMPLDLYLEIQERARESNRTVPGYIRQVLKRYLRYCEEHQDDPKNEWIID